MTSAQDEPINDLNGCALQVIRADVTRGSGTGTAVFEEATEALEVVNRLNGFQVQGCVVGVTMDGPGAIPVPKPPMGIAQVLEFLHTQHREGRQTRRGW